ncbi:hypothetical protein FHL15_006071 [Xylaria flabelliformis]|uniref:FAD-binding FR-type domain-containing protein n=1 Tax=Xylaria flabelliformis TaxID=2512241 RepID=A0A553HYA9_9PEZI|nr:hypothetical protein FHL15_006071 [Xylaria flabelliformis]
MTTNPDHLERTATEPRDKSLHTVVLRHIEEVNDTARVFRLGIPRDSPPIRFLPGQWLDVYVPGVERAGGFTITSTPKDARLPHPPLDATSQDNAEGGPYLELAVQKSPENPPAAWLWQSPGSILGTELCVRIGGSFVFPPPGINVRGLRRVVFVAGGMGVNPLVSMLGSLASAATQPGFEVHFLYSLKDPNPDHGNKGTRKAREMLFVERIARIFRLGKVKGRFRVFLTSSNIAEQGKEQGQEEDGEIICADAAEKGEEEEEDDNTYTIPFHPRRYTIDEDVAEALGSPSERRHAVVYVCSVPSMTDEFVARLTDKDGLGMDSHRVLCEKWW